MGRHDLIIMCLFQKFLWGGGGDACMKVIQESEIKRSKQGRVQILE